MQNCSIRIEGLSEKTTTEALRNYFENTKRSNGGDVENATIVGETAFVLFAEHEGNLRNFHIDIINFILTGILQEMVSHHFEGKKVVLQDVDENDLLCFTAARRVVERGNHTIDGSALTVSLVQPNGA